MNRGNLQEFYICILRCLAKVCKRILPVNSTLPHQYLLCLKVPKKQALNTRRGRTELKKSQLSIYLLTTTIKHINESCTLLSSSLLCGHSPKRRQCDEPEESKAKPSCFKISLTGKLISALKLSFLELKQEKLRGEKKTFSVSEFLLLIFNGASVHL